MEGHNQPPITCPFTVAIDTREQAPFQFLGFVADKKHQKSNVVGRDLYIPTETMTLKTGDYSIVGLESEIAVERKSLADLFGTLGGGRDRFVRELERLNAMQIAEVVVEADWQNIFVNPPKHSQLRPKTVYRSVNAWKQEFRNVHWNFCYCRGFAEHATFRILERFWNQKQKKIGRPEVTSM